MKFALISHLVPPSGTGQSLVIYRMLSGLDPKDYCLISTDRPAAASDEGLSQELQCNYYKLPPPFRFERGYRYVREHECGVVVDESDPARLAEGIQRILRDAELRQRLGTNAWTRARADFDITQSRKAFAELIGLDGRENR